MQLKRKTLKDFYSLKICVLILAIFACGAARASDHAESCHKTAMGQSDMNLCALDDAKKADAELDAVYQKLMAKISAAGRSKLQAAEEAWVTYRQKECEFETLGTIDGSVHPMIVSECYAYIASQQTKNLREQLDCEEGNLSCVRQ